MNSPPSPHIVATELLDIMPQLKHMMDQFVRSIDPELSTLMQVRVLLFLAHHPQTVSALAKKRGVSLQAASTLIQGLVERGWVVRVPDPDDRRQARLQVTPEGMARARLATDQMTEFVAGFLAHFEPNELDAAQVFIRALKRALAEHPHFADSKCDLPDD